MGDLLGAILALMFSLGGSWGILGPLCGFLIDFDSIFDQFGHPFWVFLGSTWDQVGIMVEPGKNCAVAM